jgi:hypothetical protein
MHHKTYVAQVKYLSHLVTVILLSLKKMTEYRIQASHVSEWKPVRLKVAHRIEPFVLRTLSLRQNFLFRTCYAQTRAKFPF